jgi:hypothetical protein
MKRILTLCALVAAVAGVSAGAALSDAGSAQRLDIYGPNFQYSCNLESIGNPETPTGSHAVLRFDKDANTVGATVQLKGLAPNTSMQVRLIQGVADCFTIDGTIVTNGQGNGTLAVSEAAVSTKASVFVWGSDYSGPYYMSAIFQLP